MFDHLLESSRWDDSNNWFNIGFSEEIGKMELKVCTVSGALGIWIDSLLQISKYFIFLDFPVILWVHYFMLFSFFFLTFQLFLRVHYFMLFSFFSWLFNYFFETITLYYFHLIICRSCDTGVPALEEATSLLQRQIRGAEIFGRGRSVQLLAL